MNGEVTPSISRAKRQPAALYNAADERLVARVEERLAAANARETVGLWKLHKRNAKDRVDLITIARNLHAMLGWLPHGRKVAALTAAGFGGGEQSGYLGNLTIPPSVMQVGGDRWRRLTPVVSRYLDVALGIEPDRTKAIVALFRGTSFDATREGEAGDQDWADRLTRTIGELAARVSARTNLPALFDRMSSANIFLAEGPGFEPLVTSWLSETFHKFDFSDRQGAEPENFWLFDRNDPCSPRCGAPLFSPKIALERQTDDWTFPTASLTTPDGKGLLHPAEITIRCRSTLYLALAPMAVGLDDPATVAPWLFERPEAFMVGGAEQPVWRIKESEDGFTMWSDAGRWELGARANGVHAEFANLFVDGEGHAATNPDLEGSWWCRRVTPALVRERLGRMPQQFLIDLPLRPAPIAHPALGEGTEWDEVDLHAVDPLTFAPWRSIAAELQKAIAAGDVRAALEDEVTMMDSAFRDLQRRVRDSFPSF